MRKRGEFPLKKIIDSNKLDVYVSKYNINDFFTINMRPYMELILFKKNEQICKQDEEISYLFFLVDGKAKTYRLLKNGRTLLLIFNSPFQVIGDVEFMNKDVADSNVEAVEDTCCVAISFEYIRKFALSDHKFLQFMCNQLANKLRKSTSNSSVNLLYPLENRLASYILEFVISKEDIKENIKFQGNLVQVAQLLGSSYRHLLRTLKDFCDKGILRKCDGGYEILRKDILIHMAV